MSVGLCVCEQCVCLRLCVCEQCVCLRLCVCVCFGKHVWVCRSEALSVCVCGCLGMCMQCFRYVDFAVGGGGSDRPAPSSKKILQDILCMRVRVLACMSVYVYVCVCMAEALSACVCMSKRVC